MHTPEITHLILRAQERHAALFAGPIEMGDVSLASFRPPYYLAALGVCAELQLFSRDDYPGPIADLVLVPSEALHAPDDAWAALEARIEQLRSDPRAALARPLSETLGLREIVYSPSLLADSLRDQARERSLAKMKDRFAAVEAKVREHFGLRLPRWTAVLAACFDSLDELERAGLGHLGRSPAGVMDYFVDGGLDRKVREGLDPRLEMRFRRDPPEMVSFLWGEGDGQHFGMFYDDPAELPARIVSNWARDTGETGCDDEYTGISLMLQRARERIADPYRDAREPIPLALRALERALAWFVPADEAAVSEDGPVPYRRDARVQLLGGVSAVLPQSAFKRARDNQSPDSRYAEYKKKRPSRLLLEWFDEAREELAKGKPAFAYVLGRELHWFDGDAHRKVGAELLIAAYRALGRDALAEIARVHTEKRDLPSVGVFERG
jgi:hypothetical protein